jgi:hypothetical protein
MDSDGRPRRRKMFWTISGFPILDGKYLDLDAGEAKALADEQPAKATTGPPTVAIYWYNLSDSSPSSVSASQCHLPAA